LNWFIVNNESFETVDKGSIAHTDQSTYRRELKYRKSSLKEKKEQLKQQKRKIKLLQDISKYSRYFGVNEEIKQQIKSYLYAKNSIKLFLSLPSYFTC